MNKKIKIIDLLNKKANNEKMPKKFKYKNYIFELDDVNEYTIDKEKQVAFTELIQFNLNNLNDEIEILEDNTEEIEELDNWFVDERKEYREFDIQAINLCFSKHRDKINELVKTVKEIRKEQINEY